MADIDTAGRGAFNAVFGDRVVAGRTPDILVQFQYNVSTYDVTTTTSGDGTTAVANATLTLSTGAGTGAASVTSAGSIRYQPGFDGYVYFTAAFPGANSLAFVRRFGGAEDSHTIAFPFRAGDIDLTKINIYRINYGWLGVAPNVLEVYNGLVDGWIVVASFETLNKQVLPSVYQPALPITASVSRTTGEQGVCRIGLFDANDGYFIQATGPNAETTLKTCSWSAGRIGCASGILPSDRPFGASDTVASVTTEVAIASIRNASTFQGRTNRVSVEVDLVSLSADGTKTALFYLKKGVTLGGTPNFVAVDASNSVTSVDVAGTTVTGGTIILPLQLAKVESKFVNLQGYKVLVLPGETLTISATSASASDVGAAIRWRELF